MKYVSIALMTVFIMLAGCGRFEKELLISKDQIQRSLDQKFPFDKNAVIARLTLDSARVYFKENRVGMKLTYYGNFLSSEIRGSVDFNGTIFYRRDRGAFYLKDFDIVDISINEANFSAQEKLKATVLTIVRNYLDDYAVYRLNQGDFKQNLAKLILRNVSVRGENLVILLGI